MFGLAVHPGEAVGDRLEPGRLRRDPDVLGDVRAMHDLAQPVKGRIGEMVLQEDGLEAAAAADMAQLHALDVERDGALALRRGGYLLGGHEEKLSLPVHETSDEHGQAIRSTCAFLRVTHFMSDTSITLCSGASTPARRPRRTMRTGHLECTSRRS